MAAYSEGTWVLTPKQEKFCQLYVEIGNASEAYRQAYNSKSKPEAVNVRASEMLSDRKISVRVNELRAGHAKRHAVTVDSLLAELEEARRLALDERSPAPAVAATMGKARITGLDKQVIDHRSGDGSMSPTRIVIEAATGDDRQD
jgi:phage terminase small subunit